MPRDSDKADKGCGGVGLLALRALGHLLGQSRETGSSLALGLLEGAALCLQRDRNAGEIICLLTCVNNIQDRWCPLVWAKGRNKQAAPAAGQEPGCHRPCHLLVMEGERWHVRWQVG